MRENLFKGIREDNGEWIYGDLLHDHYLCREDEITQIYDHKSKLTHRENVVISETVGQYTGIRDINADKIFEHDIVRKYVDGKELIGVVEFSDGAFGVRFADGSGQLLCFFGDCCEIIGNIHNDPEITLE